MLLIIDSLIFRSKTCNSFSALDIKGAVREAVSLKATFKFEDRKKKLENLVNFIASRLKVELSVKMPRNVGFFFILE